MAHQKKIRMTTAGFEPARANTADLKSAPLDHSGKLSQLY
jgi:hypothetical protein